MIDHWVARVLCLILLPVVIFILSFWIHLTVANRSGLGDTYMSNEFQFSLEGSKLVEKAAPVYFGSTIKLYSIPEKVYLHSHRHNYPAKQENGKTSSQGQQVTGYGHPDGNNNWLILPENKYPPINYESGYRVPVRNGDLVRLKHAETKKYLMTHNVASPMTTSNQEVTATDAEDKYGKTLWKVNIKTTGLFGELTELELENMDSQTLLMTHKESLPDWGWKQREINAGKDKKKFAYTWTVKVVHQRVPVQGEPPADLDYKNLVSFWQKTAEILTVPFERKTKFPEGAPYLAAPLKWPLLDRGVKFWNSADKTQHVFLICNPVIWYLSILSIPAFIGLLGVDVFIYLRGGKFLSSKQKSFLYLKGLFFFGGFVSHFYLFAGMGKPIFLHEYLPCYLFSVLVLVTVYQVAAERFKILNNFAVIGLIGAIAAGVFFHYSAFTYGSKHPAEYFQALKLSKSWVF